ncbi:MAG: SGNH/GDSL hydrolase family protein [Polyangiaceae bacterium]
MRISALHAVGLSLTLVACDDGGQSPSGSSTTSSGAGSTTSASSSSSTGTGSGTGGGGGGTNVPVCEGFPTPAMPLISRGAPAFASDGGDPSASNDENPASQWSSNALPAWLAYDLSGVPLSERGQVLVSWYAIHAGCYIDEAPSAGEARPISYVIEANAAPGGATAPVDGWTPLVSVVGSAYCGRQHLLDLAGRNWIRMRVTEGTDPSTVGFDLDVQSAPTCASDAWLFMGDSITYMSLTHAFCDLPALVEAASPGHFPAVLDAAIGGTSTASAVSVIDKTIADFPGRFVVLAYGTNDHANDFHMEELVAKVLAAGKTPVVPRMPWSQGSPEGQQINALIDALYVAHPEIVRGPDLWAVFEGRTDLIPAGDVHPNAAGQEELRKAWAQAMVKLYE